MASHLEHKSATALSALMEVRLGPRITVSQSLTTSPEASLMESLRGDGQRPEITIPNVYWVLRADTRLRDLTLQSGHHHYLCFTGEETEAWRG